MSRCAGWPAGLYGVVDLPGRDDARATALARGLLDGGARVLQLRMKRSGARDVLETARLVGALARAAGVPFVVNDRVDLALLAGADGVHLGQDDLPLVEARALARDLVIGISTHTPEQAEEAARAGADYLGFGPVFATRTKENPDPVQGLGALEVAVRRASPVPVVAIGGIEPRHAAAIWATGAKMACAISSVNGAANPVAAAREFLVA